MIKLLNILRKPIILFAIYLAKLIIFLIRFLHLGRGSSLPGRVALKLYPSLLQELSQRFNVNLDSSQIFVTGTNGKTTTTGLLASILGPQVISNQAGANLYYGIVTELIRSYGSASNDFVLELDEAAFPNIAKHLKAKALIVTNIYRDQLDRFGEIDSTQKLILQGINNLLENNPCKEVLIVLNVDVPKLAEIANLLKANREDACRVIAFSLAGSHLKDFDVKLSSNIENQVVDYTAMTQESNSNFSRIAINSKFGQEFITLNIPGEYNIYNAVAAYVLAKELNKSYEQINNGINNYRGNFGRAEKIIRQGKTFQSFLIKNPTGATEVLKELAQNPQAHFLIIINDNYADGRDISWLWDAEFELLSKHKNPIYCSGHRAEDMALRLKYAGIASSQINIVASQTQALKQALEELEEDQILYVLPTYTALLALK